MLKFDTRCKHIKYVETLLHRNIFHSFYQRYKTSLARFPSYLLPQQLYQEVELTSVSETILRRVYAVYRNSLVRCSQKMHSAIARSPQAAAIHKAGPCKLPCTLAARVAMLSFGRMLPARAAVVPYTCLHGRGARAR